MSMLSWTEVGFNKFFPLEKHKKMEKVNSNYWNLNKLYFEMQNAVCTHSEIKEIVTAREANYYYNVALL
jgi:hypothetical protein